MSNMTIIVFPDDKIKTALERLKTELQPMFQEPLGVGTEEEELGTTAYTLYCATRKMGKRSIFGYGTLEHQYGRPLVSVCPRFLGHDREVRITVFCPDISSLIKSCFAELCQHYNVAFETYDRWPSDEGEYYGRILPSRVDTFLGTLKTAFSR